MEHAAKKLVGRLLPQGVLAGLLFGMMLCFSLIPCVSVQAETVIDSVEATVTQPVGWAKPSGITATPGNDTYQASIKYVQAWSENFKDFVSIGSGTEFTAGEKYQIVVKFVPESGYTFSDSLRASINGNAASRYTMKDGSICFSHTFTALPINSQETCMEVSSIAVKSNVQTPATGAAITNPSCDIISNSAMTVQETGWINVDTGIKGSGVFTAGNWYCYVLLRLEGDAYTEYKFAATENMTLTVNGSKWTVTEATNGTDYATVRAISTTWTLTGDTPAHSHTAKAVAAKAATCIQAGNIAYYTCSGCDKWFKDAACTTEITDQNSVVISATGHTWSEKIEDAAHLKEKAADCRFCNTYWYDCAVCNTISKTQFFTSDTQKGAHSYETEWNKGDASGHWHVCQYCKEPDTVKAHVPGSAATETTPQTCTECGYVIAPALGHTHNVTFVTAKAATCTETGNTAYYTCSGCGKWFKDAGCTTEITDQSSVVKPANGHIWSEEIEDKAHLKGTAADCRSYNTYWYDCAVCDAISGNQFFTSETQQGAHSYRSEWNKGDASGHWHNCQYCGERDTVVAHVPGSAATETSPQTCVKCGYIIVPAKGHTTHNAVYVAAQEATCIRKGNEVYYTCSGCEKWFRDEECTEEIEDHSSVIISALGHNWSEKIEDKSHLKKAAADCRSCNVYWYDCVMCDAISSNKYFTGKTRGAHSYEDEWNEGDASGHWHDCQYCDAHDAVKAHIPGPSATEEKPQTCTECGYVIKDTLIEEDSKGTQTTNGETNPTNSDNKETSDELPEEGTTLEDDSGKAIYEIVIEGNTVEYVSTISRSTATVTIPSTVTIDNVTYKVTGIAENAFKNNKTVKKVVIGKNVTTIGNSAFSGAVKLKTVTIGANVTSIGDKAFYKCTALTKITIPSKVTKIGKSAFYGCKNLKNITIKTTKLTTKKVGSKAFYGIHKKATIKVPKSKLKAYKTMLKGKGLRKSISIEK